MDFSFGNGSDGPATFPKRLQWQCVRARNGDGSLSTFRTLGGIGSLDGGLDLQELLGDVERVSLRPVG
jgi:hypothetical protein